MWAPPSCEALAVVTNHSTSTVGTTGSAAAVLLGFLGIGASFYAPFRAALSAVALAVVTATRNLIHGVRTRTVVGLAGPLAPATPRLWLESSFTPSIDSRRVAVTTWVPPP